MPGFVRYWLPPAVYALLIFVLSGMSRPPVPRGLDPNFLHYPEYAVLAFLLLRAFHGGAPGRVAPLKVAYAFLCSAAFGLTDEIHQAFVPQRVPDASDFVHDLAGTCAGIAAFCFINHFACSRKKARGG